MSRTKQIVSSCLQTKDVAQLMRGENFCQRSEKSLTEYDDLDHLLTVSTSSLVRTSLNNLSAMAKINDLSLILYQY